MTSSLWTQYNNQTHQDVYGGAVIEDSGAPTTDGRITDQQQTSSISPMLTNHTVRGSSNVSQLPEYSFSNQLKQLRKQYGKPGNKGLHHNSVSVAEFAHRPSKQPKSNQQAAFQSGFLPTSSSITPARSDLKFSSQYPSLQQCPPLRQPKSSSLHHNEVSVKERLLRVKNEERMQMLLTMEQYRESKQRLLHGTRSSLHNHTSYKQSSNQHKAMPEYHDMTDMTAYKSKMKAAKYKSQLFNRR